MLRLLATCRRIKLEVEVPLSKSGLLENLATRDSASHRSRTRQLCSQSEHWLAFWRRRSHAESQHAQLLHFGRNPGLTGGNHTPRGYTVSFWCYSLALNPIQTKLDTIEYPWRKTWSSPARTSIPSAHHWRAIENSRDLMVEMSKLIVSPS